MTETVARVRKLLIATLTMLFIVFVFMLALQWQILNLNRETSNITDAVTIAQAIDDASACRSEQASNYNEENWRDIFLLLGRPPQEEQVRIIQQGQTRKSLSDRVQENC